VLTVQVKGMGEAVPVHSWTISEGSKI